MFYSHSIKPHSLTSGTVAVAIESEEQKKEHVKDCNGEAQHQLEANGSLLESPENLSHGVGHTLALGTIVVSSTSKV